MQLTKIPNQLQCKENATLQAIFTCAFHSIASIQSYNSRLRNSATEITMKYINN
jgi:hypothetical protein